MNTILFNKNELKQTFQKHPLEVVGVVALGGVILGSLNSRKGRNLISQIAERFHDEIEMTKGVIAVELERKLESYMEEKFPEWAPQVNRVLQSATNKFGKNFATPRSFTLDKKFDDKVAGSPPREQKSWRPGDGGKSSLLV